MSGGTRIGIIVFDDARTSEITAPVEVFGLARQRAWFEGATIQLIGITAQTSIRTAEGLNVQVDATINDDLQLDVLIVPGAYDVDPLLENQALNAFIQKHAAAAQWVSSFCAGAFLLANAGVLDGKQATTWHGGEAILQTQFPQLKAVVEPVVIDQRVITANAGLVSYRASLTLLAQLTSYARAREIYVALGWERLGDWAAIEAENAV